MSAKFIRILLLGLALSNFPALAAEPDAPPMVRTQFRVFPVERFERTGIFYRPSPEASLHPIRFRPRARSLDLYAYEGPQPLTFYREDGTDGDGLPCYRPVGQVPVSGEELLVFFAPTESGAAETAEFNLLAMDDGPLGLPVDHVTFLNFTRLPFACRFLEQDQVISPGPGRPISLSDHLRQDLFIGLAITNEDSHRVVLRSRWQFHPGNRHYVLLLPPQDPGSFRIRAVQVSEFVGANSRFLEKQL